jgi:hypothetical protein
MQRICIRKSAARRWARARDSGGAIAPTTIHTYRKATVFGRIVAEILFYREAVKKIGAESPAPARSVGEAPIFFPVGLVDYCMSAFFLLYWHSEIHKGETGENHGIKRKNRSYYRRQFRYWRGLR